MVKEMSYRLIRKALLRQGCTSRPGRGDHEVWTCPDGTHKVAITRAGIVSAGLVRRLISDLACLPEGWLQ